MQLVMFWFKIISGHLTNLCLFYDQAKEIVLKLKELLLEAVKHHESPASFCFSITQETEYEICYVDLDQNIT
jgi:hypothetical protein